MIRSEPTQSCHSGARVSRYRVRAGLQSHRLFIGNDRESPGLGEVVGLVVEPCSCRTSSYRFFRAINKNHQSRIRWSRVRAPSVYKTVASSSLLEMFSGGDRPRHIERALRSRRRRDCCFDSRPCAITRNIIGGSLALGITYVIGHLVGAVTT
jgi:hypothetical protein